MHRANIPPGRHWTMTPPQCRAAQLVLTALPWTFHPPPLNSPLQGCIRTAGNHRRTSPPWTPPPPSDPLPPSPPLPLFEAAFSSVPLYGCVVSTKAGTYFGFFNPKDQKISPWSAAGPARMPGGGGGVTPQVLGRQLPLPSRTLLPCCRPALCC